MPKELPLDDVKIDDDFLSRYYKLVCDSMLPYQWDALNDLVEGAEKSYCIENIRIAAGLSEGKFNGMIFQDSDAAKWLEAVAYCLKCGDGKIWEERADEVIDLISKAQEDDGYFNTYFQLVSPEKKFTNLYEAHELYCLGHFIEAAVAYYQATGKRKVLDIFCRYADLADSIFGNGPGKRKGYPGHQEIELALAKLYEETGEERYLKLAKFFLDERGTEPHFFADEWKKRDGLSVWSKRNDPVPRDFCYNQAHLPVREQKAAVGHAVRALYMYAAMAEVGRLTEDETLIGACRVLLDDIRKQMYVTGGVGQTNHGEAFTFAYDLPNEVNYSETCASIALVFFMQGMLKAEPDSLYADIMERALYNTVLASIGTDGKSYFYVNPMEAVPEASEKNPARHHAAARRQKWHRCACCPPNAARLLASTGKYLYTADPESNTVYFNLYAGSQFKAGLSAGGISLGVKTDYPLTGDISVTVESISGGFVNSPADNKVTLAFRVPDWNTGVSFKINGADFLPEIKNGYALITRQFYPHDNIEINFDMTPRYIYANTRVRADAGKACLQRGPIIYCLEQCDNGDNLHALLVSTGAQITGKKDAIGGMPCVILETEGFREIDCDDDVYTAQPKKRTACKLRFVPYYLWGNRSPGEMLVWARQ